MLVPSVRRFVDVFGCVGLFCDDMSASVLLWSVLFGPVSSVLSSSVLFCVVWIGGVVA